MPSPAVPSGAMRQASPPSVSVERKMDRSASRVIRGLGPTTSDRRLNLVNLQEAKEDRTHPGRATEPTGQP